MSDLDDEVLNKPPYTNGIAGWVTSGNGGDVGKFRVAEEASDEVRQALQPAQPGGDYRLHLLGTFGGRGRRAVVLDVLTGPGLPKVSASAR